MWASPSKVGDSYQLVLQPHKICLNICCFNGHIPFWNTKRHTVHHLRTLFGSRISPMDLKSVETLSNSYQACKLIDLWLSNNSFVTFLAEKFFLTPRDFSHYGYLLILYNLSFLIWKIIIRLVQQWWKGDLWPQVVTLHPSAGSTCNKNLTNYNKT